MDRISTWRRAVGLALALGAAALAGPAAAADGEFDSRKVTARELAVELQRVTLPNGLTLLLAPAPKGGRVAVWLSFRAGTVFEPAGKSGLAHLVEHVMASGPTPATDYAALLETRRATHFNATTGHDVMSFEAVVPSEELASALWAAADRLGTLPGLIDDALVARHRRVVLEERALHVVDAPYGLVEEQLSSRLFAAPHPLHAGVGGTPDELATVTVGDVQAFVATQLVPANAVLVVAGGFDPAQARRLVEAGLGRLSPGRRTPLPRLPPPLGDLVDRRAEPLAREPRVTLAWRFPGLAHDTGLALQLGAQLLAFMVDGAWDMRVGAELDEYGGEAVFLMQLTVPYDEPMTAMEGDADGLLRFLTRRELPVEVLQAGHLALDRSALVALDDVASRAALLTRLEHLPPPRLPVGEYLAWHWRIDRSALRDTARLQLREPRVVMHARPTRPKQPRLERE